MPDAQVKQQADQLELQELSQLGAADIAGKLAAQQRRDYEMEQLTRRYQVKGQALQDWFLQRGGGVDFVL
jgi:hypothetical protein